MDPDRVLRDCEAHLRTGELVEAAQDLADYWEWRRTGFERSNADRRARDLARWLAELDEDYPDTD